MRRRPLFPALVRGGYISAGQPVYAVDLDTKRLARVSERFPWIETVAGPADSVPEIADGSLDVACSTMVMEHVPDEGAYLDEIQCMLRPGGSAYLTTVFKKQWVWHFRRRDSETVLDTSHLREYTDLDAFVRLVTEAGRLSVLELERRLLWFPLLDPVLFRLVRRYPGLRTRRTLLRALRGPRVPIPGYYSLAVVLERSVPTELREPAPF